MGRAAAQLPALPQLQRAGLDARRGAVQAVRRAGRDPRPGGSRHEPGPPARGAPPAREGVQGRGRDAGEDRGRAPRDVRRRPPRARGRRCPRPQGLGSRAHRARPSRIDGTGAGRIRGRHSPAPGHPDRADGRGRLQGHRPLAQGGGGPTQDRGHHRQPRAPARRPARQSARVPRHARRWRLSRLRPRGSAQQAVARKEEEGSLRLPRGRHRGHGGGQRGRPASASTSWARPLSRASPIGSS